MPHGGLALANSLATTLEVGVLLWLMNRRLNGLRGKYVLKGAGKSVTAVIAMSAGLVWWLDLIANRPAWVAGLGGIVVGGVIYVVVLILLRLEEIRNLYQTVRRRFK